MRYQDYQIDVRQGPDALSDVTDEARRTSFGQHGCGQMLDGRRPAQPPLWAKDRRGELIHATQAAASQFWSG